MLRKLVLGLVLCAAVVVSSGSVSAQTWPEIFNPLVLRTINLQMAPADWQFIQTDNPEDPTWKPAQMWLTGEAPILVAIRRKRGDPLTEAEGYIKVSYKIDVNELVAGQEWHGLRAVSLDNGDDNNVLTEGLAWYLHRIASGSYGYNAGMAAWVRLIINGVDTGVYCNSEQRDKRFLQNRGLWAKDATWLYDAADMENYEIKEGVPDDNPLDSPTVLDLCYSPFARANETTCPTPSASTLASQLPLKINMQSLLTLAAIDAFCTNPDAIFSKGKNFYFSDWLPSVNRKRLYFPWDLDASLSSGSVNDSVYEQRSPYSQVLLNVPEFRAQYSQILNGLINGPFSEANLFPFIDSLKPVLSAAVDADPNNQLDGTSTVQALDDIKSWFTQRIGVVRSQIGSLSSDTAPPMIVSVTVDPSMVAQGDSTTVTVSATDNIGVTAVTANGVALSPSGTNMWNGSIPGGTNLGVHSVVVSAADAAGNTTTNTSVSYATAKVFATSVRNVPHQIMGTASLKHLFTLWGTITVTGPNDFTITDGCDVTVRVVSPAHGLITGDFVSARGVLDVSASPATLTCQPGHVAKRN